MGQGGRSPSVRRRTERSPSVMETTEMRTPAVRGRDGAGEHGTGSSPKAKRPIVMVQPEPVPVAEAMSLQELTAAVKTLDARGEARLTWCRSIADAVDDHADQLEALTRESLQSRARLVEFQEVVQTGTAGAEAKIKELFVKSDILFQRSDDLFKKTDKGLVDLEAADAALKAAMEGKIGQLEHAVQSISQPVPSQP